MSLSVEGQDLPSKIGHASTSRKYRPGQANIVLVCIVDVTGLGYGLWIPLL